MDKKLNLKQLVWIGTGHVIGAGVVSIVGSAQAATGNSVWLAFLVACILSFIRILPVIFFTSATVAEGGRYGIITRCAGSRYGGLITLSGILSWSARGTAVLALCGYISDFAPHINSKVATVMIWSVFCIANMFGINMMSRIQAVATPLLITALTFFSAACIADIRAGYLDFNSPEMFLNGSSGFFTAVVLLSYSCDGIASLANYSAHTENPTRNIPRSMITVSCITTAIYIMVGFACGAVLPLNKTAGKTLLVTAQEVLQPALFYAFILFGPVFALVTTMNAGIADSVLPVMAGVKEGWLPVWLARQNKYGAYYVSIVIIYVIGIIPTVLDFSVAQIASITMVLGRLGSVLLIVSAVNFPFIFEKEWKESHLYIPGCIYFPTIAVCAAIEMFVVVKALNELTFNMIVLNIGLLFICILYGKYANKKSNNLFC